MVLSSILLLCMQKSDPEEDMDIRGGGQAAEDCRIVKEEDYASDNDADFMEEDRPQHQHQQAQHAQHAAGFESSSRGGTPGRGSVVSLDLPNFGIVNCFNRVTIRQHDP